MSTAEEIVNGAKALPPEQQAELKEPLAQFPDTKGNGEPGDRNKQEQHRRELQGRIHSALHEAGLVTGPEPPPRRPRVRRPPITVSGKPVSETIIEERS